jgi:hypothetical protein
MAQQPPAPPPPPTPPPPGQPPAGPVYSGVPGYGARPAGVNTAGVLLFVVGGLRILFYLLALIGLAAVSGQLEAVGVPGGAVVIGIIVIVIALAAGVLQIMAGVQTRRLRRRGRVLGLVGTIIGLAVALLGLLTGGGAGNALGVIVVALLLIGDIAIIVLLAQSGRYLTNP